MPESFESVRDPVLSLFQSAVAEVAERIDAKPSGPGARRLEQSASATFNDEATAIARRECGRDTGIGSGARPSSPAARDLSRVDMGKVCVELALRYVKALASGNQAALAEVEDEYRTGTCDVEWVTTLRAYAGYFGPDGKRKPIPYVRPAQVGPGTHEIKAGSRLALVSDWGTGARPAMEVLRSIAGERPDVLVHLGDIYYSGTGKECEDNFLRPVTRELRAKRPTLVYTLSGNHDMYCGGVGYYDLLPKLNEDAHRQRASFFCLRSTDERWQFLAMDTGLHDDNPRSIADALTHLEDDELEWHCQRIEEFGGRTILLSHHQPFSAFSAIGAKPAQGERKAVNPHLMRAFERMNRDGRVAAWFWGHEHSLGIYEPFSGIKVGRCIGHGAVPVSVLDDIYKPLDDLEQTPAIIEGTRLQTRGGVFAHGYAVIDLGGGSCRARYLQVTDAGTEEMFSEEIS